MPAGRPLGPLHDKVLALHRAGKRPCEIAVELGITRQYVSMLLKKHGIDGRMIANARRAEQMEQVRQAWQAMPDRTEVARRLGLTKVQVAVAVRRLRQRGVNLRPYRRPSPVTSEVARLVKEGLTTAEIVRRGVASHQTVWLVRRSMRKGTADAE
jgi:DNA-binding CsgD family transcriptional regulator